MLQNIDATPALLDFASKAGGTTLGIIVAIAVLWKQTMGPLFTKLLEMHESIGNNVIGGIRTQTESLASIAESMQRHTTTIEESLRMAQRGYDLAVENKTMISENRKILNDLMHENMKILNSLVEKVDKYAKS